MHADFGGWHHDHSAGPRGDQRHQTNVAAGNQCADSYWDANKVSATTINGQTAWNYVVSVRITLSFTNPIAGQPALQFTRVIGIMSKMGVVYINGLPT